MKIVTILQLWKSCTAARLFDIALKIDNNKIVTRIHEKNTFQKRTD